jgi:hypothetical protein
MVDYWASAQCQAEPEELEGVEHEQLRHRLDRLEEGKRREEGASTRPVTWTAPRGW